MNCYYCGTELIHKGDNRLDNDEEYRDIYDMVTYLKCPFGENFANVERHLTSALLQQDRYNMNRFVDIKIQPGPHVAVRIRFQAVIGTISDLLSHRTARWVRTYLLCGLIKGPVSSTKKNKQAQMAAFARCMLPIREPAGEYDAIASHNSRAY